MSRRLGVLVVAAIALSTAPLFAHDMWIEPTTFSPEPGQVVGVRLRVGQDLLGDPVPRDPALVNQFVVEDAAGRKPVVGRNGTDPAGFLRVAMPGLLVIGYRSNPSAIELVAEKFNQYLKEEGLDAVAALRARRKETGARAHELFSRCAKSLVLSGSPIEAQGDRRLGFPLELVAERKLRRRELAKDGNVEDQRAGLPAMLGADVHRASRKPPQSTHCGRSSPGI